MKNLTATSMVALLIISIFLLVSEIQPVKAEGTIYIRANGSIDPSDAPILTDDRTTYTLTGNVYSSIVVQRNNIAIDGEKHWIQGAGAAESKGIDLSGRTNVGIRNIQISNFYYGIYLSYSFNIQILDNHMTNNLGDGIKLSYSSGNNIIRNNMTNNLDGIGLVESEDNRICENNVSDNTSSGIYLWLSNNNRVVWNAVDYNNLGIWLGESANNFILHNNFTHNTQQSSISASGYSNTWNNAYPFGGNYWSNFAVRYPSAEDTKSGPYQDKAGSDGFWDSPPYFIDVNNQDNYPLVNPCTHVQVGMVKPVDDTCGNIWVGADKGPRENFRGYYYYSYRTNKNRYKYVEGDPALNTLVFKEGFHVYSNTIQNGGVTYFNYKMYHEGIDISAGYSSTPTPKFSIGDWVRTTASLYVRTGAGLSYPDIGTMPLNAIGQIAGGPVEADGFVWWDVAYDTGDRGWSADKYLEPSIYGRDVYAAASGTVIHVDSYDDSEAGKWVWIYHGDMEKLDGTVVQKISTRYLHLDTVSLTSADVGREISKGAKIGTVGKTGTYYYHSHFEVRQENTAGGYRNTRPLNPLDFVDYKSDHASVAELTAECPVDLIVADPDGLVINKETNDLPSTAKYDEAKYYEDYGEGPYDHDAVIIYDVKLGDYLVTVVPEPEASPTDTFSLQYTFAGTTYIVAENVQISDIPVEPYVFNMPATTIYIRPDGSIDPSTAPISTVDNITYTLTEDILSAGTGIVVERSNIIVEGDGYALQGSGSSNGFYCYGINNATVKNTNIDRFEYGVYLESSSNCSLTGNNVTSSNSYGIWLKSSSNNNISSNNIENNGAGIYLNSSSHNSIFENNIKMAIAGDGIYLQASSHNRVSDNNIIGSVEGIGLDSSSHNTVSGNTIANNTWSIGLGYSSNNSISGNNITANRYGVSFFNSSRNSISGNNIKSNWLFGVLTGGDYSSNYNNVTDNNIANNHIGIWLSYSSYNRISGNTFANDGLYSENAFQNSVEDNTVNGRPLVYLEGVSGYTVDDAGQVILVHCEDIRVEGLNLSNTTIGVELWETGGCTISGNNITANTAWGIMCGGSSHNNISGNNIADNGAGWGGAGLGGPLSYSNVSGNTFTKDGLALYDPYENSVENNTVNGRPLVYLEGASDSSVEDAGQVILVRCEDIRVEGLNLSNTYVGVQLWETGGCTISGNNVSANWYGIDLCYSSYNSISGNTITNNQVGIVYESSNCTSISHNNVATNTAYGITLNFSCNSTISENNIEASHGYGIWLGYSSYNSISSNTITNNQVGAHLESSNCTSISHNNVTANSFGITLDFSCNSTISENNIEANGLSIVVGTRSSGNRIFYNSFLSNNMSVSNLDSASAWDNGYPSGGNYWSDYTGIDVKSGSNQDQPGSDGIGDTPYTIDGDNADRFPLVTSWTPENSGNGSISKGSETYEILFTSNATVLSFDETPGSIRLSVAGESGSTGYVRIVQPVGLNATNIKVFLNNTKLTFPSTDPPRSISTNGTHYFIYFTVTFNSAYELLIAFPLGGDVNYDGDVDIFDIVTMAGAYGTTEGQPKYTAHCDVDDDGDIDIFDIVIAAGNYGKSW